MTAVLDFLMRARSGAELAAGLAISAVLTAHLLLTKPNVTAAAGWIGVVWVSPIWGGLAYFVLGINRVKRRAQKLRLPKSARGEHAMKAFTPTDGRFRALVKAIGHITARPVTTGNLFRILHDGDETYPAMLAAIAGARASICLSTYIMRADATGQRFTRALQDARERGVAVRVIVDGIGSGWLRSPAYHLLAGAGVPVARFMHSRIPWKMPFLNLRSHKKILVVDGTIGFTGGINISDQNLLASHPHAPVQDTHFEVHGPIVGQLVAAFATDWAFVTGETLEGAAWFPDIAATSDAAPARVVTAGPDEDLEKIEFAILEAITCAHDSIQIMTPYFLPEERLMTALSLAAIRGVAVDIVLPECGDHHLVDWAWRANVAMFLRDGGHIWCSPQPFRHSKMMVVDGKWCLIGSSNWDMRSFRLNFELCVEVYDAALATQLEGLMTTNRGRRFTPAALRVEPLAVRLRNAAARLLLPYL